MRFVVFGANGGAGRALVQQALDGGHEVAAVTRHPEQFGLRHDRLEVVRVDATNADSVAAVLKGRDAVLSTLGVPYTFKSVDLYSITARNIIAAMRLEHLRRLIVVTSVSADPEPEPGAGFLQAHLFDPFRTRVLGRTVYDDMRRMETTVRGSGLDWTIVRPPALFDAEQVRRYDVSTSRLKGQFASRPDLAALMLHAAVSRRFINEVAFLVSREGSPSLAKTIWNDGIKPLLPRLGRH